MTRSEFLGMVRRKIATGEWPAGMKLPSTRDMADAYELGQTSVNYVMGILVDRGELVTRAGGGEQGRWVPGAPPDESTADISEFRRR